MWVPHSRNARRRRVFEEWPPLIVTGSVNVRALGATVSRRRKVVSQRPECAILGRRNFGIRLVVEDESLLPQPLETTEVKHLSMLINIQGLIVP